MQLFPCLALLLFVALPTWAARAIPPLKKITVVASTNQLLDKRYQMIPLPPSLSTPYFKEIRSRTDDSVSLAGMSEFEGMRALCSWVHRQWVHDGRFAPPISMSALTILDNARWGERYNCEGYARVLMDVLLAHGFVARTIYLKTPDAAYAPPGQGHVAVSAWVNALKKWIFLDPQFDGTVLKGSVPQSWTETCRQLHTPARDSLQFVCSSMGEAEYRAFLERYNGYIQTLMEVDNTTELVTLPIDTTRKQFLTFQGLPADGVTFTAKLSDMYMPVNGVTMTFYAQHPKNYDSVLQRFKITTVDDYMKFMPLFTAEPSFMVRLTNSMPWFGRYEVAIDNGPWKPVKGSKFAVTFHDGMNVLRTRAVNAMGVVGPETRMDVLYE